MLEVILPPEILFEEDGHLRLRQSSRRIVVSEEADFKRVEPVALER